MRDCLRSQFLFKQALRLAICFSFFFSSMLFATEKNTVNVYTWSGIIPDAIIQQFEKETGIKVNFSTYDSNEIMYAKLRANKASGYDLIEPSSYYIDRMRRQNMLQKLDKTKLPLLKNLNPDFLNQAYDPHNYFSLPLSWGITGIFINKEYVPPNSITKWADLWDKKYENQLLMLDDSREVFSIGLKTLGYSANDNNPEHIKQAYLKLKELMPNVKIFNSDAIITLLVDEDATKGMVWNGDVYKAKRENPNLEFIFPSDGFVIWVDNLAIPKNAPHRENAYKFINYLLRADVGKTISVNNGYPTTNLAAKKLLPPEMRNDSSIYPSHEILRHGEFQTDVDDAALELYEKYWEKLKMEG